MNDTIIAIQDVSAPCVLPPGVYVCCPLPPGEFGCCGTPSGAAICVDPPITVQQVPALSTSAAVILGLALVGTAFWKLR